MRSAWIVVAHSSIDLAEYPNAENAYKNVLALTPADDETRPAVIDGLAASIYKQGEEARILKQVVAAEAAHAVFDGLTVERFAFDVTEHAERPVAVVDSLSLNDFVGTSLRATLAPYAEQPIRVGGVAALAATSDLADLDGPAFGVAAYGRLGEHQRPQTVLTVQVGRLLELEQVGVLHGHHLRSRARDRRHHPPYLAHRPAHRAPARRGHALRRALR